MFKIMIEHSKGLEKIIAKRISQRMNYMETLRSLYGADPRDVWRIFKRYNCEPGSKIEMINLYPELPEPHLAYSQWRMTHKSTELILENLNKKKYERICFLGCPVLGMKYKGFGKAILLDIDKTILDYAKLPIKKYDVNEKVPDDLMRKFECVVADPPWYSEDIKLFAARSAELVKKGGTIYLSIPRLLTRPLIPEERLNFQKWLTKNNLIIAEIAPSVEYEVPPFEFMAYLDIPAFTGEVWRVGDWLKLKKADESCFKIKKTKQVNWIEFSFGKKRIFLREKEENYQEPRVKILNSLILNSVSKRNPLIPLIDIWSSRNAVFHIESGYSHIKNIFLNLEEEYSTVGKFDKKGLKDDVVKNLIDLIST